MVVVPTRIHGGADGQGVPLYDFSTNSNATGPCPAALEAVRQADACHYPDPEYTHLRQQLADWHGVAAWRVVLGASASELIQRLTAWAQSQGSQRVLLPLHSYGEYAHAAQARGMDAARRVQGVKEPREGLQWACEPASPTGQSDAALACWLAEPNATENALWRVCDCAYLPLRLDSKTARDWLHRGRNMQPSCWQMYSPNKALGLTGVRAAYAIAPLPDSTQGEAIVQAMVAQLNALAPSWPLGSHGVAMLMAWVQDDCQRWLDASRIRLTQYRHWQQALCARMGWEVMDGSLANYLLARPPVVDLPQALLRLRKAGIKLRDCSSFGLPGWVRLGVQTPEAQDALEAAWAKVVSFESAHSRP